jgi:capsid protein
MTKTATFEDLFADAGPAYDDARARKVAEIAEMIRPDLRADLDAASIAADMMVQAEEQGRIDGDEISFELPGKYTIAGAAVAVTV